MFDEYICLECKEVKLYKKEYKKPFPETLELQCEKENKLCLFKRIWNNKGKVFQVAEGLFGNSKNGFTNNATYIPADMTPLNKVYGSYGRTAGVETEGEC